jgi:predicted esterase
LLASSGLEVAFHPFDDQHTIPPEVMAPLAEFLANRLPR